MDKREAIIDGLKEFKKNLSKKLQINKMIFFGSRVSGDPNRWSDIDLIIISPEFRRKKFRNRALGFYKCWNLDYPVDFLCYTPEEFKKKSKQVTILREAVKNGIEIK